MPRCTTRTPPVHGEEDVSVGVHPAGVDKAACHRNQGGDFPDRLIDSFHVQYDVLENPGVFLIEWG